MHRSIMLQIITGLLCFTGQVLARESGLPFIRNFPSEEYRASQQNWAIVQDRKGIIYIANNDGLLEYDGVSWRLFKLPGVRSLAIDSTGRLYAGLENDLGYLQPDHAGNWQFVSLKDKIPENHRDISTVFTVFIRDDEVLFNDQQRIYIYKDEKIRVIHSTGGSYRSFMVKDNYFVQDLVKGLFLLQNDSLVHIEGGSIISPQRIATILPYEDNDFLIFSRNGSMLVFSPENPLKFSVPPGFEELAGFLRNNPPYCSALLADGNYAVGTFVGGVIVFDREGRITHTYNKSSGLQDNTVLYLFHDQNHQLWVAMDNGISLIESNIPFRKFTEQNGLQGTPICLRYFSDRLYAGTSQYLHVMNRQGSFTTIAGTTGQNFDLFDAGNSFLLANLGIFEIRGEKATLIPNTSGITALYFCPLKNHSRYLLTGAGNGLYLMENDHSRWRLKWKISGFDLSAYVVKEDEEGILWVGSAVELFRLEINETLDSVRSVQLCSTGHGLPTGYGLPFRLFNGEVVFGTEEGIYRYLPEQDRFEPHPDFPMLTGKVTIFRQEKNGKIWFEETVGDGNYERGILSYENGKYIQNRIPFNKFTDLSSGGSPENVCFAPDGTVFFGIPLGILQYDPSLTMHVDHPFHTLIRKVYSRDSLLFGGALPYLQDFRHIRTGKISWSGRDMVFHYASTFFDDPEKTLYSYRLSGSDTLWSGWTTDHKKEYTNLPGGHYTFEVRSKNQYQTIGSTSSVAFIILPPWYLTWYAFLGYILLLGVLIYGLIRWRTRKLEERGRELEKIVEQRTTQIREQKKNVEQLSRIGRDITASLSIENIIHTVYQNVNTLMDASVFTIGLHNPEDNALKFPAAIEKNQTLQPFSIPLTDENRLGAWCFNHRQEVIINDYEKDYSKYIGKWAGAITGEVPQSVLYLPLWNKDKVIGVISTQSFSKNAYSDYHVNILRNLATYSAIALENADSFRRLSSTLEELKSAQDKLVTQSKLAALGTLTAGIAHEIKNPLNFISNFSELNVELVDDLQEELRKEKENLSAGLVGEVEEIIANLKQNAIKIREHGRRADSIVRSMLLHSRGGSGERQPSDINAILEEAVNLTYHGMRAQDTGFNIKIEKSLDESIGKIEVVPQEISRAFLNIVGNACYEAFRKKVQVNGNFSPLLSVRTLKAGNQVKISVHDNGNGIPEAIRDRLFTPFFTTKPAGQGTGLGLSITWDIIVHQHNGRIHVDTAEGENSFTEFTITLPVNNR